jgi:hypothetical protein
MTGSSEFMVEGNNLTLKLDRKENRGEICQKEQV